MRKRDVVGRTIVDVRRETIYLSHGITLRQVVTSLVLDNGMIVYPSAHEGEDSPQATLEAVRPTRRVAAREALGQQQ